MPLYRTQAWYLSPEMLERRLHFSLAYERMSDSTPVSQGRAGVFSGKLAIAKQGLVGT